MLHYVALTQHAPAQIFATDSPHVHALQHALAQCNRLDKGQHRLCFEGGRVLLTVCVGGMIDTLREQQFDADAIVLDASTLPDGDQTIWALKALARRCKRATHLTLTTGTPNHAASALLPLTPLLLQCGFVIQTPLDIDRPWPQYGAFNPRWDVKNTREPWRLSVGEPQHCVVIGAGLAGASVAASLARRGWRVLVVDMADQPAQGASGLPVGLTAPVLSADDNVLSRLTRSGARLSLQQAQQLLTPGQDWALSGVEEIQFDTTAGAPPPALWHAKAGWIKPASLITAWLRHPAIEFQGNTRIANLRRSGEGWQLMNERAEVVCTTQRVVLANATGAMPLLHTVAETHTALQPTLSKLPAIFGVRGLVSWAQHDVPETRPFPPHPVNGNGSLIAGVPFADGQRWFLGASYQPISPRKPEWPDDKNHGANVLRLDKLLPELSAALTPVFEAGALSAWKGVRCVSADRLPLVGSVLPDDPTLWLCFGMGSRGLTHTALCAEVLAAHWAGEPLPIEASLAQQLWPQRK